MAQLAEEVQEKTKKFSGNLKVSATNSESVDQVEFFLLNERILIRIKKNKCNISNNFHFLVLPLVMNLHLW